MAGRSVVRWQDAAYGLPIEAIPTPGSDDRTARNQQLPKVVNPRAANQTRYATAFITAEAIAIKCGIGAGNTRAPAACACAP